MNGSVLSDRAAASRIGARVDDNSDRSIILLPELKSRGRFPASVDCS